MTTEEQELAAEQKRARHRVAVAGWRARNPESDARAQLVYRQKNKQLLAEKSRQRRQGNKERIKAYEAANREKTNQCQREYRARKKAEKELGLGT